MASEKDKIQEIMETDAGLDVIFDALEKRSEFLYRTCELSVPQKDIEEYLKKRAEAAIRKGLLSGRFCRLTKT